MVHVLGKKLCYYGKKLWYNGKNYVTIPKTMELWYTMEKTMVLWKNYGITVSYR